MPNFNVYLSTSDIAEVMGNNPEYVAEVLEIAASEVVAGKVIDWVTYDNLNHVRTYLKELISAVDSYMTAEQGYAPHVGRMVVENTDLSEKILNLESFLKSDNKPSGITEEQINDLVDQLSYMNGYQKVLSRRIETQKDA